MTKSRIFFIFCLFFIIGIFLSSIFVIPYFLILLILFSSIILIIGFWKFKKIVIFSFCLIFLNFGVFQHQKAELKIKNNQLEKYNDLERDVILTGIIIDEPDIRENNQKLTIRVESLKTLLGPSSQVCEDGPSNESCNEYDVLEYNNFEKEKVLITVGKYPKYKHGDRLKVKGKLQTPIIFDDFNYKDYLSKTGIYSVIYYPEIKTQNSQYRDRVSIFSRFYRRVLGFKEVLRKNIYQNLEYSQAFILGAMILGDKNRIPQEMKEKLNIAGIRHITAVSGMHIVILSSILMSLLIGLGFWRGQAFYFSVILIFLFVVMTGLQVSAIRAGIMGMLFLLAQKVGRKSISSRTIVIVGSVMLFFNPLLLLGDVGFQLSFLAVIGIINFGPILKNLFQKLYPNFLRKNKIIININNILIMTFSAYIFTFPILIYNFGQVSLVSPLTNILILPIVPLIMIFGFIFVFLGMIWSFLGLIFSIPVWFLLFYLLKITDFFSKNWAVKSIDNFNWFWIVVYYLILTLLVYYLNKKQKLKFLNY
ncbi:MAG: ComEC/Rec2 family competence protein [Candidatus Nealsonbacteria bacterium]